MSFGTSKEKNGPEQGGHSLNLIGRGTVIIGSISASASIRVEGEIKGQVASQDLVTIGNTGVVEGDVEAKNIVVGGRVNGNLTAQEKLVLEAKCSVSGDIRARRLVVDEGALYEGKCAMRDNREKPSMAEGMKIASKL